MRKPLYAIWMVLLIGATVPAVARLAAAQEPPMSLKAALNGYESVTDGHAGMVEDWSTHHIVFSRPAPGSAAYEGIVRDPRYWMQQIRRAAAEDPAVARAKRARRHRAKVHRDWSYNLGSGARVGAGMFPAKFGFATNTTPSCSDFVVFNTGLGGSASQASIAAFTNIYTGCSGSGAVPTILWAYNTGASAIATSVVLSLDGTQVAFAQGSNLVLLKWSVLSPGTIGGPTTPTAVAAAGYRACAAPCMTSFSLTNNDSISSPFVDYANDILYVGDDKGVLHEFNGVFNGTPSAGASVTLTANNKLTGPIFDSGSGLIFIGDSGGFLYSVTSGGTVVKSGSLSGAPGIVDGPLVDSSAGMIYVVAPNDMAHPPCNASHGCSGLVQIAANFAAGAVGSNVIIGGSDSTNVLYDGAFDNLYFTSANPASPSGNLYVCGNSGRGGTGQNAVGNALLYRVPITANALGAPSGMATALSTARTICSPVTEFLPDLAATDLIFLSVEAAGSTNPNIGCPGGGGGCIVSFNVNSGTTPTATASRRGEAGGTSGIVIDNNNPTGPPAGGEQVYFSTLSNATCATSSGNGGCAVQDSQSPL